MQRRRRRMRILVISGRYSTGGYGRRRRS